ncbi:hypothetical protein ASC77_22215 [Nocardioides sp. Root1257]|nr:hypothetical protein ASC77_22215 [Nocardioides sp. Root1257]KRC41880.1 hypothetical protein ASE24_22005 [Nocardioides sp. Root224]
MQNGGTATLALGMALGSARLVAMAIVFVLVGYYALAAYDRELGPIGLHWLYLLIPAILLVPWWTVIAASILVGTGWLLGGRRSRAGILAPTSIVSSGVDRAVLWSACLTVLFVIASADSWLPAERIEVGDQAAFTGYVLGERDGRDLVTLDATGSHGVRAYPIDDVTRSYCEPQGGLFFDTLLTVFRADTYASCPD